MNTESIGVLGLENSMAELFAAAERELSAFVIAVNLLFEGEPGLKAANNWIDELERTDWPTEAPAIDWRKVTIAAAASVANGMTLDSVTVTGEIGAAIKSRQSSFIQQGHPTNRS